jgi:hypothetical protein
VRTKRFLLLATLIPGGVLFFASGAQTAECTVSEKNASGAVQESELAENPAMNRAWDHWQKRLTKRMEGFVRRSCESADFHNSGPLKATLSYIVTSNGGADEIVLQEKSSDIQFNSIVLQSIRSPETSTPFPEGSRRTFVRELTTFTAKPNMRAKGLSRLRATTTASDDQRYPVRFE